MDRMKTTETIMESKWTGEDRDLRLIAETESGSIAEAVPMKSMKALNANGEVTAIDVETGKMTEEKKLSYAEMPLSISSQKERDRATVTGENLIVALERKEGQSPDRGGGGGPEKWGVQKELQGLGALLDGVEAEGPVDEGRLSPL